MATSEGWGSWHCETTSAIAAALRPPGRKHLRSSEACEDNTNLVVLGAQYRLSFRKCRSIGATLIIYFDTDSELSVDEKNPLTFRANRQRSRHTVDNSLQHSRAAFRPRCILVRTHHAAESHREAVARQTLQRQFSALQPSSQGPPRGENLFATLTLTVLAFKTFVECKQRHRSIAWWLSRLTAIFNHSTDIAGLS